MAPIWRKLGHKNGKGETLREAAIVCGEVYLGGDLVANSVNPTGSELELIKRLQYMDTISVSRLSTQLSHTSLPIFSLPTLFLCFFTGVKLVSIIV